MISFDDLVDSGVNTEEIENDLRNIRLNTQINRFSIIDCTNSIETLSSNTLALYNSITGLTSSGGGGGEGFDYIAPYIVHSTESFIYNCNDILNSQSFPSSEILKEVGPNINFDNVSFTTAQNLSLKGQSFNSCLIQSNTEPMILDYKMFQNGNIDGNFYINISAKEINNNSFNNDSIIKITDISQNTSNVYSKITKLKIDGYNHINNTYNSIFYINYDNSELLSNVFNSNSLIYGNNFKVSNNTYSNNKYIKQNNYSLYGNSYNGNNLMDLNVVSVGSNTYNNNTYLNLKHYSFSKDNFMNGSHLSVEGWRANSNTFYSNTNLYLCNNSFYGNSLRYISNIFNNNQYNINNTYSTVSYICNECFSESSNSYSSISNYCGFLNDMRSNRLKSMKFINISGYKYADNSVSTVENGNFCFHSCANNYMRTLSYADFKGYQYISNNCSIFTYLGLNNYQYIINNSLNSIKTLNINCNDLSGFSGNKFDSINKLHLNDGSLLNSSLSNTFTNVSSYYFKYTDGLYNGTDIINDYTSISNSAFIKYVPCSWLNKTYTSSGGSGGFNYWQSYDEHPILGYNVSERLESDIINNNIQGVGPAADFYDCTFKEKYVNLTGNEFVSNHIYSNSWYHDLKYLTFNSNSYEIINTLKINCDICSLNTFNKVKYLDLTCKRPFDTNSFISCTEAHINNMGDFKIFAESCGDVNICGGNIVSGVLSNNDFVKINCNNFESFNYSNKFNEISCYGCNNNTFNNCDIFNLTAYNMSNNIFNSDGNYKVKCYGCNGLTAEVRQFSIEGYNIKNCLLSSYNEGDVSSLWSHDVYLKAFFAESISAFRISNLHLDVSAYLLNANISNIGTLYLNYTLPFISEQKASSDTNLMNNVYIYSCSHFDFPDIGRVVNNGVYNWSNVSSQYVYINGVPLSKLM